MVERINIYAVRKPGMTAWSYHLTAQEAQDEAAWANRNLGGGWPYRVRAEEVDADDPVVRRLREEAGEAKRA